MSTSAFRARVESLKNKDGRTESYRQYRATLLKRIENRIQRAVRAGVFQTQFRIPVSILGRAYVDIDDIRPPLMAHLSELGYQVEARSQRDLWIGWDAKAKGGENKKKEEGDSDEIIIS